MGCIHACTYSHVCKYGPCVAHVHVGLFSTLIAWDIHNWMCFIFNLFNIHGNSLVSCVAVIIVPCGVCCRCTLAQTAVECSNRISMNYVTPLWPVVVQWVSWPAVQPHKQLPSGETWTGLSIWLRRRDGSAPDCVQVMREGSLGCRGIAPASWGDRVSHQSRAISGETL